VKRCILPFVVLLACDRSEPAKPTEDAPAPAADTKAAPTDTINDAFAAGPPTFIRGTAGNETDDLRIATQVDLVRGLVFPGAAVKDDTEVGDAWPANPVVYGAPHRNRLIQRLGDGALPGLEVADDRIRIGEQDFEGADLRLVALIPASESHPQFVYYAGTGPAGIAEINAGIPTGHAIVLADRFGPLVTGSWQAQDGKLVPQLGKPARRIEYRSLAKPLPGFGGGSPATVRFAFPSMVAKSEADAERIDAAMRGLAQVVAKLQIASPVDLSVYLYPDRRSKQELTGNGGDGHAIASSNTLHVLALDAAALESLVAHEGTHVLGYHAVGPAATPLVGEGMAVWVAGSYGGKTLAQWNVTLAPGEVTDLLGPGWMKAAEQHKYPRAAAAFGLAVDAVGLDEVGTHLMTATAETWAERRKAAGLSPLE